MAGSLRRGGADRAAAVAALLHNGHENSCNDSFRHACLGTCGHGRTLTGLRPQLQFACDDANSNAPLRALLEQHVRPPTCRLAFFGDSVVLDLWTAAVLAVRNLDGFELTACDFKAGHELWQYAA